MKRPRIHKAVGRSVKEWIGATPNTPPPPRVKLRIWTRDGGRCYLTGRKIQKGDKFEYEHKIALINGGENRESNIFLALADKHKAKTKRDMAEKSRVAARAKSDIGAKTAPARPIKSAGFRPSEAKSKRDSKREETGKIEASGLPQIARRYV